MNSMTSYSTIFRNASSAGNPNKEKTLTAWRLRAINTRQALLEAKKAYRQDIEELRKTYSNDVFNQKRVPVDQAYRELVDTVKEKILDDLDNTLEGKRKQFDISNSAPSEENLRLLTVLNMRKSLTAAEVAAISGKFGGNLPSLRLLREICLKHNISFPDVGDPEVFEEQMARAEQFSRQHVEEIDTDKKDFQYRTLAFWEYPDSIGEVANLYMPLDTQSFTTEQLTEYSRQEKSKADAKAPRPVANKTEEGQPAEMWALVRAKGRENVGMLADQFHTSTAAIREANPGKSLDMISAGDQIYIPSTRYRYQPDPSGAHVQPDQISCVPKPVYENPTGPNGEAPGDDIDLS